MTVICIQRALVIELWFGLAQVRAVSVKRISNPITLDTFGNVLPDGLYDRALGPDPFETCKTCGLGHQHCPGHFGHIELPVSVYNPLNLKCVILSYLTIPKFASPFSHTLGRWLSLFLSSTPFVLLFSWDVQLSEGI